MLNTAGYQFGTAGTLASNGTLLSPYLIRFAQTAEFALPDRTVIDFTGGDVWTGAYVYGLTSMGSFELVLSTVEADLIAMTSGSSVDQTTNSRLTIFGDNIMRPTPPQVFFMVVFRIQSKEAGSKGADKFLHVIYPRAWVSPKGIAGAPSFQTAGTYNFTVVPTIGDRMPWGPLFGTNQDFDNNETPNFYIIADNPLHLVGYLATAAATNTITLPFLPVGPAIVTPDSATDQVMVWVDGEMVNADSVDVTTGEVETAGPDGDPLTAGQYIGILYETQYVVTP